MTAVRIIISGLTAIIVALLGRGYVVAVSDINQQKATGLVAVDGGLRARIQSPGFWILVVFAFALFFAASRVGSKTLRVILFWIPTILISTLGIALFSLYAWLSLRKG